MSVDKDAQSLLAAMTRKAEDEHDKIVLAADEKIKKIADDTESRITALTDDAFKRLEYELRLEEEKLKNENALAVNLKRLAIKWELIEGAFQKAGEMIKAGGNGKTYEQDIIRLAGQAVRFLYTGRAAGLSGNGLRQDLAPDQKTPPVLLKVRKEDQNFVGHHFKTKDIQVKLEGIDAPPGTVLALNSDRTQQIDNSLFTRLARFKAFLLPRVAAVLFEEA